MDFVHYNEHFFRSEMQSAHYYPQPGKGLGCGIFLYFCAAMKNL